MMNEMIMIIPEQTEPIRMIHKPDQTILQISLRTACCYNELLRRLQAANWNAIQLEMKQPNGTLTLLPCSMEPIQNINDVELYMVQGGPVELTEYSLIRIAADLCKYQTLIDEEKRQKQNLRNYYDQHIAGHSHTEIREAGDLACDIYGNYHSTEYDSIDDYLNAYLNDKPKAEQERIRKLLELSDHWSIYSDTHKSLYGFRP